MIRLISVLSVYYVCTTYFLILLILSFFSLFYLLLGVAVTELTRERMTLMVYWISTISWEYSSTASSKSSSSVNKINSFLVCASSRRRVAPFTKRLNATILFSSRIKVPFEDPSLFQPVRNSMIWERIKKSPF